MPRVPISRRAEAFAEYVVKKHGTISFMVPATPAVRLYDNVKDEFTWYTCDDPLILLELNAGERLNLPAKELILQLEAA